MSRLTRKQANAIQEALSKIDPKHPDFRADTKVRIALGGCRLYLETWCIPVLEGVLTDAGYAKDLHGRWREVKPNDQHHAA